MSDIWKYIEILTPIDIIIIVFFVCMGIGLILTPIMANLKWREFEKKAKILVLF